MLAEVTWNWTGLIVVGGFLLLILGVAYGYYTRTGSAIDAHPVDDRAQSPGAKGPATVSGAGRTAERSPRRGRIRGRFSGHGTR
jgi:hypothetical protein